MDFEYQKLKNGAEIISIPIKDTQTAAILIGVRVGSRDEKEFQAGTAHFLEHMFFKGTQKRPTYLEISRELDGMGANFNAFTTQEMTGFYIQSAFEKQQQSAEILFDLLQNNTFPLAEIVKEKAVISEEINMYEDMPQHKAILEFNRLIFKGSSLARPIAGSKKTIASISRKRLRDFMATHYIPPNLVVAVAGRFKTELIDFIRQRLEQEKKEQPLPYPKFSQPVKRRTKTVHKRTDQAHIVLGVPAFSNKDPRRFALLILNSILGGMMSSRLFVEIREKRGLAYYISSSASLFMDTGVMAVRAGLTKSKLDEGLEAIRKEIKKLKKVKVKDEEIQRAKDNFKGHLYLNLEDSLDVTQFYLNQQLLRDEILQPSEIIQRVERITKDDIIDLANILFDDRKQNLVVIK
jgi:predicted Zn-dependent peptidase